MPGAHRLKYAEMPCTKCLPDQPLMIYCMIDQVQEACEKSGTSIGDKNIVLRESMNNQSNSGTGAAVMVEI